MLCEYNIWRVKSLQFQQATTQKKRKIADSLYVEEAEEDEPSSRDAHSYLDKLWTLLLAYAMAGCWTSLTTFNNPLRQQSLHEQLSEVDFICAAFDCSTKSRAREIPQKFEDGRPCPAPTLRTIS